MICLGIESSCDETAVAIIQDGRKVLANVVSTQIPIHKKFGHAAAQTEALGRPKLQRKSSPTTK